MEQPPQNVTLQLLVLSNKSNLNRLLNSYSALRDQLKYYTTRRNGQEKYILIYGSFASSEAAQQQKAQLPAEIRQAVVNRFAVVQAEASRDNRP
jgi:DamX protein